jgi:subtilase family serine protease
MSRLFVRSCIVLLFLVISSSWFTACTPEFYSPPTNNDCKTTADCPGLLLCEDGKCVAPTQEKSDEEPKAEPDTPKEVVADENTTTDSDAGDGGADDAPDDSDGGDNKVDEPKPECRVGESRACYTGPDGTKGVGPCKGGIQTCNNGQWGPCVGEVLPKDKETCNGIDDNCDGKVDETLKRNCYSGDKANVGVGTCREGTQVCDNGIWGRCYGEVVAETELCDGKDNDCDGDTDEGCKCKDGDTQECGSDVGECKKGKQTCSSGTWGACVGEVKPAQETCDNKDNNCDGTIDEGLTKKCYGGPSGTAGKGPCLEGTQTCKAGQWGVCTGEILPTKESCDNKDNDCDGQVDEDVKRDCYGGPSGTAGKGVCKKGTQTCSKGLWGQCSGEVKPSSETCDGKDNDCDGQVDEIGCSCTNGQTRSCSTSGITCKPGTQTCSGGKWGSCVGEVKGSAEICDGKDNDCDSSVDEGGVCKPELSMGTWKITPQGSRYDSGRTGYGSDVQIDFQIKNTGNANAGSFTVTFYYGSSSSTAGLIKIGSSSITSLSKGKSTASLTLKVALPSSVLIGTRYIHYFIDSSNNVVESSESNNRGSARISITGRPEYVMYYFRVSNSGSVPAGGTVPVSFQIRNNGASGSTRSFKIGLYYSTDSNITTSDTRLYTVTYSGLIQAAQLVPPRITTVYVKLPTTAKGTVYIGAIVDYEKSITEVYESNNARYQPFVVQAAGSPDLKMSAFSFATRPPASVGYKTSLSFTYEVINTGKAAAKSSYLYLYYANGSDRKTNPLTKLISVALPSLDSGRSSGKKTISVTLPSNVWYGTRYIHYAVDATNIVSESDENNNFGSLAINVSQLPDMVALNGRANTSVIIPKVSFPIEFQLQNRGYSATTGTMAVEIYHSTDSSVTTSDKLLWSGSVGVLNALQYWPTSGLYKKSVTLSGKVGFPPKTKTEYIGIWVNRLSKIKESSTRNNLYIFKISVQR